MLSAKNTFLTYMKNVIPVMINVGPADWLASRLSLCNKNFNVAIFWDTINMINVKLCIMVVLIELYLFTPLSVTLITVQGHSTVSFN